MMHLHGRISEAHPVMHGYGSGPACGAHLARGDVLTPDIDLVGCDGCWDRFEEWEAEKERQRREYKPPPLGERIRHFGKGHYDGVLIVVGGFALVGLVTMPVWGLPYLGYMAWKKVTGATDEATG